MTGDPGRVTSCNCTQCRRYGALWAYDYEGERIVLVGETRAYIRRDGDGYLEIRFCPACANVVCSRALQRDDAGRRRVAINLRLAPPETVAHLPIRKFDGHDAWQELPDDRCVRDLWC